MEQLELFEADYIAHVSNRKDVLCDTPQQVWEAIGRGAFGSLYYVSSPTGKDVSEFVPF